MGDRPDYVKCVLVGESAPSTWCGRTRAPFERTFLDAGHAAADGRDDGWYRICPECSAAIVAALQRGTWKEVDGGR